VAIIQRFGAALNVNVHAHALVLDGVFAEDERGGLVFHPAPSPDTGDMDALVAVLAQRIHRVLVRRRVPGEEAESTVSDSWADDEPVMAGLTAASVQGRVALGPRSGAAIQRCGALPDEAPLPVMRGTCHAAVGGVDLDATVRVPAGARDHLERVCRYALRPPIAQDRIQLAAEGDVLLALRHRWSDGTTHLRFHPLELLERLASLTPRPRINLVLYYGVLGAHAAWRSRLPSPGRAVATSAAGPVDPGAGSASPGGAGLVDGSRPVGVTGPTPPQRTRSNWLWAQLMQRSFGFDVLACPRCGGAVPADRAHRAGEHHPADSPSTWACPPKSPRRGPRARHPDPHLASSSGMTPDRLRIRRRVGSGVSAAR
jgi:hypothetical protein